VGLTDGLATGLRLQVGRQQRDGPTGGELLQAIGADDEILGAHVDEAPAPGRQQLRPDPVLFGDTRQKAPVDDPGLAGRQGQGGEGSGGDALGQMQGQLFGPKRMTPGEDQEDEEDERGCCSSHGFPHSLPASAPMAVTHAPSVALEM